jgi:transketolase
MADMCNELPGQFFMEGVSEAAIIGMAAGMAMEGAIPYINTIATFLTRRAMDQITVDGCLHKLPIRLIANGGGLVYAPLGSTHLAIEDIAIMRALPNMSVVCPADAHEMERFMLTTPQWPGPIYIRLGKGFDPIVTADIKGFEIGRGYLLRKGGDILLITTGVCLQPCLAAADRLAGQGISVAVLHLPTVKPLDQELLLTTASPVRAVLTVEEHTVIGGLGSAVAEVLAEADPSPKRRFRRLGIPDVFPDYYGAQQDLMARFGLDAAAIAESAVELIERGKAWEIG